MAEGKIVKNQSSGYGYKYSNLADLHRAGIEIPKMRVKPTEFGEFIEYYDEETKEWMIGAKIVEFEAKGMNAAQAYGASLTYARRYTVQMAKSVACDDDDAVEMAKPVKKAPASNAKPSTKQINYLRTLLKQMGKKKSEADEITDKLKTAEQASAWIEKAKKIVDGELSDDIYRAGRQEEDEANERYMDSLAQDSLDRMSGDY